MNTEQIIYDVAESINNTTTHEELSIFIWKYCKQFGVENFVFGASLYNNLSSKPEIHMLSGYPVEWWDRYEEQNYLDKDITVAHCKSNNTPMIWPPTSSKLSKTNKQIFSEAAEFGIRAGISFPYHSVGCEFGALAVSVSDQYHKSVLTDSSVQMTMQILGASLFDFLKYKDNNESCKKLTKREIECLKWVAAGKTSWETSVILGIAERTVVFHLQNAATKMNTASRTNAAVIAVKNGLI